MVILNGNKKWCNHCKQFKLFSKFYKDKSSKDNLSIWCKQCINLYQQSDIGKLSHKKVIAKRKCDLGFIIIDIIPFPATIPMDYHHITNKYVIAIPTALHRMCYAGSNKIEHRYKVNKILIKLLKGEK